MAVKVLVVDDHEVFRRVARAVVGQSPEFELVGEAATGEESIEQARGLCPELVLMDIRLPGMDGLEAARRITADPGHPVVVLISTTPADELGPRLGTCGAAGFINKEAFGPATLSAAWEAATRS
jgi:DNA-binding NarL/FixJ family response regulator